MAQKRKTKSRTKPKTKKSSSGSKFLTYVAWTLSIIALALAALLIGYYVGYSSAEVKKSEQVSHKKVAKQTLPSVKKEPKKKSIEKRLQEVLKKESHGYTSAAHEIENEALAHPSKKVVPPTHKKIPSKHHKPKLAIIIDDCQTASQVRAVNSLHMTLTKSFLPPREGRPDSAKIAAKQSFYMVHLPMEAMHFASPEPDTLRVGDSQQKILARIAEIKKLFPRVHYLNNHTGSKFTADTDSMKKLIFALNQYHIRFIDSRTTAQTKAPIVLKEYGMKYVARDVFLDHKMSKAYVLGQIKEAIKVAKRNGHAIAIGHPHKNTLEALYESKALLNKEVDLVLVKDIY